jgi:PAS domain S-box-containing protein
MPNFISFSQSNNASQQIEMAPSLTALQELARQNEDIWELLAGVFDNLSQGIILADRNGRVVVFNQAAEKIMGYQAAEVVGRQSLWDFCEECDRPPLFRESLLRGQSFPEEEVEMYAKDNRRGPVGVKVKPLYGQDGVLKGALATLRSLEESRAREREHKSLVRLASIGRIISAIAHEINNPLQTVRTSLELGLDPRKTPDRRQAYLETADQEITRISRVIGQMRDFYRPNPGQKHPTDVNDTLREALALLDKQIEQSGVEVNLELASNLPAVSLIDYQLQQVFLNLILNALEAMPEGGRLFISSQLEGSNVLVAFHDSAEPLHPHHAANLFDPFAANGRGGELALGLSVSREIITELGGSIEIQSDDGNTLVVRLPY